jgi:hypothetical protein
MRQAVKGGTPLKTRQDGASSGSGPTGSHEVATLHSAAGLSAAARHSL